MVGSIDLSVAVAVMVRGDRTGWPLDGEVAKPMSHRVAESESGVRSGHLGSVL